MWFHTFFQHPLPKVFFYFQHPSTQRSGSIWHYDMSWCIQNPPLFLLSAVGKTLHGHFDHPKSRNQILAGDWHHLGFFQIGGKRYIYRNDMIIQYYTYHYIILYNITCKLCHPPTTAGTFCEAAEFGLSSASPSIVIWVTHPQTCGCRRLMMVSGFTLITYDRNLTGINDQAAGGCQIVDTSHLSQNGTSDWHPNPPYQWLHVLCSIHMNVPSNITCKLCHPPTTAGTFCEAAEFGLSSASPSIVIWVTHPQTCGCRRLMMVSGFTLITYCI